MVQFILFLKILRQGWSLIIRSIEHEARGSDAATRSHRRDWQPDKIVSAVEIGGKHPSTEL